MTLAYRKQPLLYFVLVGALVFAIDAALSQEGARVSISAQTRKEVASQLRSRLGRPPTETEEQTALRAWEDEEVLYREALALGLEEDDPVIRAHLAAKLRHIVRERIVTPPPTELELRTYQQPEPLMGSETFDVTHVFLASRGVAPTELEAKLKAVLSQLNEGTPPDALGDHFPRGPRFLGMTRASLEQALNVALEEKLRGEQIDRWQALSGPRGVHLLRLDRVHSAALGAAAEAALRAGVEEQKKQQAVQDFLQEARQHYGLTPAPRP